MAVYYLYHKKKKFPWNIDSILAANVRSYTYKELEEATRGFKQTVGKGAFGTVYKGVLPSDSKRFVAVKKLGKVIEEGEKEFKTEVSVIGQTYHKNLVWLLGYCDEGQHRFMVYEYTGMDLLKDKRGPCNPPPPSRKKKTSMYINKKNFNSGS